MKNFYAFCKQSYKEQGNMELSSTKKSVNLRKELSSLMRLSNRAQTFTRQTTSNQNVRAKKKQEVSVSRSDVIPRQLHQDYTSIAAPLYLLTIKEAKFFQGGESIG